MPITIPLRVDNEIIQNADDVIAHRGGGQSRNSILREMIKRGFAAERVEREGKGRK